jgi:hypothetical protein
MEIYLADLKIYVVVAAAAAAAAIFVPAVAFQVVYATVVCAQAASAFQGSAAAFVSAVPAAILPLLLLL